MTLGSIRFSLALVFLLGPLIAQQILWRRDQPPQGPFGSHLVVIGDKNGDGHDDLVTTVYVPFGTSTTRIAEIWFYSGRDGNALGRGLGQCFELARAGDVDGDGVADYVLASSQGDPLPQCYPYNCIACEVRSGRTDAVLWRSNVLRESSMGTLLMGDLDLNGDGSPDVVMGSAAKLYVFDRLGQLLYTLLPSAQEAFMAIAKFVDFDRDGCDDFLVGLYEPTGIGACDIVSGRTGNRIRRIYGVPPVLWGFGATVTMAGDLDGDGIADVILGDSGPGTPGVLEALGSSTGNLIHRWQVNQIGGDNLGWPYTVADVDVDGDGITDVIAQCFGALSYGVFIFSGRDGSIINSFSSAVRNFGNIVGVPPQPGDLFRKFATRGAWLPTSSQSIYMFSGAPPGVLQTGPAGRGTLAAPPRIGVRQFDTTGFRVTVSGAEPGGAAILVLGFTQPAVPYIDLGQLGFSGCTLFPNADLIGFSFAGGTGIASGYAAHDFHRGLVPTVMTGTSYRVFAQWVALGSGPTWPGGVSEAVTFNVRF